MSPSEKPADDRPEIVVPTMCERHRYDLLVRRMKLGPDDSWMVYDLTMQILLFQAASADPRIHARTGGDSRQLSLVLAEIGCLACWERKYYRKAMVIMRKGIEHAAKVAQGKRHDADWVFQRYQVGEGRIEHDAE